MKRFLFYFLAFFGLLGYAQNPGDVVQNFGNGSGFRNELVVVKRQLSDGKFLCGGHFKNYNNVASNYLIRLNADGTVDSSFNIGSGFNNSVNAIEIQADGKILVGGIFTSFNGVAANRIVRLNSNGSLDSSFSTGTGFNASVTALCLQNDGKLIVGGTYSSYNGFSAIKLVRLNADGTRDSAFSTVSGFSSGTDVVNTIVVQSDNKVIVGGKFTSYGASVANNIIRLNSDATYDSAFVIGSGFNDEVKTVSFNSLGVLYVGGKFTSYNGSSANRIIALTNTGSVLSSFSTGTGFASGSVNVIIPSAGKVLVGGSFTTYNGSSNEGIVLLNDTGLKDSSFSLGSINLIGGVAFAVNSILFEELSDTYVLGCSSVYVNGRIVTGLVRVNSSGVNNNSIHLGNGFNGSVFNLAVQPDGKYLVSGNYSSYNNQNLVTGTSVVSQLVRIGSDGVLDTSFNTGSGFNNSIGAIAIQVISGETKVLVGGNFTNYNGNFVNRIVRLNSNGTIDTSFNIGSGFNSSVTAIAVQSDGKILVAGGFTTYNGQGGAGLIRLNSDGAKDMSFDSAGVSGSSPQIRIHDGKIIVRTTSSGIRRLNSDGSIDSSFSSAVFNGTVNDFVVQSDGSVVVVGGFSTFNGGLVSAPGLIRLSSIGSHDTSFVTGTGFSGFYNPVSVVLNGDKILIGGRFTSYNSTSNINNIVRLNSNGSRDTSFLIGVGFDSVINDLESLQNGDILVGGGFNSYKNLYASGNLIKIGGVVLSSDSYEINKSVTLWPNPVDDVLNVESIDGLEILGVKIYDFQGKLILESKDEKVDMSNFESGIYLVNIVSDKGSVTKKVIKK